MSALARTTRVPGWVRLPIKTRPPTEERAVTAPDDLPSRMTFPGGPFAALLTDPPELADAAYAAFVRHETTPGLAEREVVALLSGADVRCPLIEEMPNYRFDLEAEATGQGRLRVFVHYLVHYQYLHETNLRSLHVYRHARGVRRVSILSGCCPVCDALAERRYRLSDPPPLPVTTCVRHGGCICGYVPVID